MDNKPQDPSNYSVPFSEKLKGLVGIFGIHLGETPHYEVIFHEGDKEVRRYDDLIFASTFVDGRSEEAKNAAFNRLAGFIFGNNLTNEKLPMISPVLQEESERGLKMSFIMPPGLKLNSIPIPDDTSIEVVGVPKQVVAVLKYSGANNPDDWAKHYIDLRDWAQEHHLLIDKIQIAQYDSPMTIPFLRRNEIHIVTKTLH